MTKLEMNTFRGALENIRDELETGIQNSEALTSESSPDDLDRIQNASERDYAMSNLERNSTRLRETNAAIRRIEGGTFGSASAAKRTSIRSAWQRSVCPFVHRLPGGY